MTARVGIATSPLRSSNDEATARHPSHRHLDHNEHEAPLHPVVGGHSFNVQTAGGKVKLTAVKAACMTQNGEHIVAAIAGGKDMMDISVFKIEQGYRFSLIQTVKESKPAFVSTFSSDEKYFVAGGGGSGEDEVVSLFSWDSDKNEPLKFIERGCKGLGIIDVSKGAICASPTNMMPKPATAELEEDKQPSFIAAGGDSGYVKVCLLPDIKTEVFPVQRRSVDPTQADPDRKPSKVTSLAMAWQESDLLLAAGASDGKLAIYQFPFDEITRAAKTPLNTTHVRTRRQSSAAFISTLKKRKGSQVIADDTTTTTTSVPTQPSQSRPGCSENDGRGIYLVCEIERAARVGDASFSADGLRLVVGSDDRLIAVFDVVTGVVLHEVNFGRGKETINRVLFSPSGKNIVVAGGGKDAGRVVIYDEGTCALRRTIHRDGRVRMLQWSRDSRRMFSAGDDGCLSLYDMEKNPYSVFPKLTHPEKKVYSVAISNDSKWLAAGGTVQKKEQRGIQRATMVVYKLGPHSTTSSCHQIAGREPGILSLSWAPNNCDVAVVGTGNQVNVYRVSESDGQNDSESGSTKNGINIKEHVEFTYHDKVAYLNVACFRPTPNANSLGELQILAVGGSDKQLRFFNVTSSSDDLQGAIEIKLKTPGFTAMSADKEVSDIVKIDHPISFASFTEDGSMVAVMGSETRTVKSTSLLVFATEWDNADLTLHLVGKLNFDEKNQMETFCFSPVIENGKHVFVVGGKCQTCMIYIADRTKRGDGVVERGKIECAREICCMRFVSGSSFDQKTLVLAVGGGNVLGLHDLSNASDERADLPPRSFRKLPVRGSITSLGYAKVDPSLSEKERETKKGREPVLAISSSSGGGFSKQSSQVLLWLDGIPDPSNDEEVVIAEPPWPVANPRRDADGEEDYQNDPSWPPVRTPLPHRRIPRTFRRP